jgi:hypothetical protein
MVPDDTALVPALVCVGCGRLIPRTGVKHSGKGSDKAQLNRALRASQRRRLAASRDSH